jgi:hypothetical protein
VTVEAAATTPATTRLVVTQPRQVLNTQVPAHRRGDAEIRLRGLLTKPDTLAVLLQMSLQKATGPGTVTLRSDVEDVPALRLAAAGASSSSTVVVQPGESGDVRVRSETGGRLTIHVVGTFEAARTATAGRIVALPGERVLRLRPGVDGNNATLDLRRTRSLRHAGPVSAVLLHVAGDVGAHGGFVQMGPSADHLDQRVFWAATSGADRTRHGFLVVPLPARPVHLRYHAGTQLTVDLVGYVTGRGATDSSSGLAVPVAAEKAPAVRVAAAGRHDVPIVPAAGVAGVTPDEAAAALVSLAATGDAPGAVSLGAPGSGGAGHSDLAAAAKPRSALALTRVVGGAVTVRSERGADVILTPRLLILR